jgi:hypothetical protein
MCNLPWWLNKNQGSYIMDKGYLLCSTDAGQISWVSYHKTYKEAVEAMAESSTVDNEECQFIIEICAFIQRIDKE